MESKGNAFNFYSGTNRFKLDIDSEEEEEEKEDPTKKGFSSLELPPISNINNKLPTLRQETSIEAPHMKP